MTNIKSYPQVYAAAFDAITDDFGEISNFLSQCPTGDILELGGGSGRTLGLIKNRKHILLESDNEMIEILQKKIQFYENAILVKSKCPSLPFEHEAFAGVFAAFGTIGEINPICVLLQETRKILKKDGLVYLSAANPDVYKSPPLGIERTKILGINDFTFISNTISMENLGKGEFQTQITVRNEGESNTFTIKQYFPTFDNWLKIIEECGFTIVSGTETKAKPIISLIIKKTDFPAQKNIATVYDGIAENYDKFIENANYALPDWLADKAKNISNLNPYIIDLACGNGIVKKILARNDVKPSAIIGFDISQNMTVAAKNNGYTHTCRFDVSKGLPGIGALSVDLITAFGLFEFIENETTLLEDIKRILTFGGELWCSFEGSSGDSVDKKIEIPIRSLTVVRVKRTRQTLEKIFTTAGLKILEITEKTGYVSPTTLEPVSYFFVRAKKIT